MPQQPTAAPASTAPPLVDQLSALLSSDELPADVYNPLAESLLDLAGRADVTLLTPEVLRAALPVILDRLAAASDAGAARPAPATSAQPASEAGGYRPVSAARAELLAHLIAVNLPAEELQRALVELLEGFAAAAYGGGRQEVEALALRACWRVYAATPHFGRSYGRYRGGPRFDVAEWRRGGRGSFPTL
jgi:hypothetical protein